jgi:hypothetical protein
MADRLDKKSLFQATDEHAAEPPPITAAVSIHSQHSSTHRLPAPHADKFRLATIILVALAIGAFALAAIVVGNDSSSESASGIPWSSWTPQGSGTDATSEIANHVAPYYRLSWANQLAVVTVVHLANPSTTTSSTGPGSGLELAISTGSSGQNLGLIPGRSVAYELCGIGGSNCSIPGTPSSDRLLLLRREALELALYTFRYVPGVQNVVAILPPGRTEKTSTLSAKPPTAKSSASDTKSVHLTMLFERSQLQPWLASPLNATLQPLPPSVGNLPKWDKTYEAGLVDQVTAHSLFSEQIQPEPDGSNLLILNQLPVQ